MKEIFKKLLLGFSIIGIIIVFFGAIIVAFLKSDLVASAYSGNYSDYVNLGDYIVKTDEEGAMPALTKQQLKIAIEKCYSGEMKTNCLSVIDDLISVQNKYKVNAAFMVAVAQKESTCGTGSSRLDLPAFGKPTRPTSAMIESSTFNTLSSPGFPGCA